MKKIAFIGLFLLSCSQVFAYEYPNAYDFFISRAAEKNNNLPQYIKPDYFRDDYKRQLPDLNDDNLSFFQKYPIEVHLMTNFTYSIPVNTFNMRDVYLSVGQTFHNDYVQLTGFITANGYFDTHDPAKNYGYVRGNAGLYDGGIQAIFLDRILIGVRGRATFDISTNTFMLLPHYYDTTLNLREDAEFYTDIPDYYLPQNMNGAGIRVGFIGKHYEIAYSQGDFMHGIPKAFLAKFNLPNMEFRFLYGHENRKAPASWNDTLSSSLVQVSSTFRYPFLNNKLWVNAIAEYTWSEYDVREVPLGSVNNTNTGTIENNKTIPFPSDAHYVRLEQSIEYYMLNLALREVIKVSNGVTKAYLEYAIYGKFNAGPADFTLGFQGSTDGRYYVSGGIKF